MTRDSSHRETITRRGLFVLLGALALILAATLRLGQLIDLGPGGGQEATLKTKVDNLIGATVEPLDLETARAIRVAPDAKGLVVTSVATRGPAAQAGLRPGDVIEMMGTKQMRSPADAAQAVGTQPGPVTVTVNRNGHHATVSLLISPTAEAADDSDPGG